MMILHGVYDVLQFDAFADNVDVRLLVQQVLDTSKKMVLSVPSSPDPDLQRQVPEQIDVKHHI